MNKEREDKIFKEAWWRARRKKMSPFSGKEGENSLSSKRESLREEEEDLEKRFYDIKKKFSEISDLVDKNYETMNTSRAECKSYLENPDNFTPQQRKMIEMERESLNETLFKEKAKEYSKALAKQSTKKHMKKRKKKMIGARKKGWIPMR